MSTMTHQAGQPAGPPPSGAPAPEPLHQDEGPRNFWMDLLVGVATQSWLASMAFHMALMVVLALIMGTIHVAHTIGQAPAFDAADEQGGYGPEMERFVVGDTPLEPSVLDAETLTMIEPPSVDALTDKSAVFVPDGGGKESGDSLFGGLGGPNVPSINLGPALKGLGGIDTGAGFGKNAGAGGEGMGFGQRANRDGMEGGGGTKHSERAVAGALNWIARHQNRDGSWSIRYTPNCKGGFCSGPGESLSDTGATALGLLPFLAAGQTHESKGIYQRNIRTAVDWLLRHQKPNGDLSSDGAQMYSHGLATIALCECYGMTQDSRVRDAAQKAIQFIESGQNKEGGWRYSHGTDESDTSVFGWQVMALKSGQMAGLQVKPEAMEKCKKYLEICATGPYRCEFSYMPGGGGTYTMTSVGLLCSQYLGAKRDDPVIAGGIDYLMRKRPEISDRNSYYWYYATQVMHNVPGPQWDTWNRQMRRLLIETQERNTGACANGSWNPNQPEPDRWGTQGGRLMVTSLCCLTLEVYYRYLPLYKLDNAEKDLNKVQ